MMHHRLIPSSRILKRLPLAAFALALLFGFGEAEAADEYWRTDGTTGGTWTSTFWNIGSANATGGTGWTAGNNAVFSANSALTFATSSVGNVTVTNGSAVTITAGGTLTLTPLISTFDIGSGSTLTWQSQTVTANSAAGITKNGAGTLDLGALTFTTNMNGGFTLNNGTVIVSGDKALGNGSLTLNGGTLQSSGTRAFAATSMTIGGDLALAGTGNANWDAATTVALGSTTRTITNNTTSGSRQFRGLISGGAGAGLTFSGTGAGQIYVGNTGNTFTGPVSITGGEVVFNGDGAFGNSGNSITLDGGRLTMGGMNTGGTVSALTSATISSTHNIFVGSTAGTSISISGATGVTAYNGVIADKTGSTGILVKQGAGMLQLGGASTYTGQTSINNGTVQLTTGNDRLPVGTVVNLGQAASTNLGTLDLNGRNQTIAGLVSTVGTNAGASTNIVTSSAAATLTIDASSSYTYSAGTAANSGVISGAVSLVKNGAGTQTLGGANTYTGSTQINGGMLNVTGSLSNTPSVTLSNSASTLATGASTTIGGTITANNGTIITIGGAGAIGTLTSGALTLNGGSTLNFDILGSSNFDKINTSGLLTLGSGTETINLAGSGFTAGTYTLLSGYSSLGGPGAFALGTTPGGGFNYSLSTGATSTVLTVSGLGGSANVTWSLGGLTPTGSTDGAGTWTNGGTNFYNTGTSAATTWDNTGTFNLTVGIGGAGGTITLGSNVRVGGSLTLASVSSPYTIGAVGGTNTLTLAGGITGNNSATINAPTVLEGSQSWNVATGNTLTMNGSISESGTLMALTKDGAGTLVLAGTNNTYSGGTTVNAGTLSVSAGSATGTGNVSVGSGATLAGAGTVNGTTSVTSGTINGSGLTLTGAVTFHGSGNSVTGTVTSSGGTSLAASAEVSSSGTLTVTGTSVAVTMSGNNTALTNLGTISQTGTGRGVFNSGTSGVIITNGSGTNSSALIQTADADVVRSGVGGITLNNYGTLTSLNASAGGSQAVDFSPITTGSNTINNFSTGIMQASEADAVRPGVNGVVNNDGLIKSTTSTGSSSDGVDMQNNSGLVLTNASNAGSGTGTGLIEGARHGVTGAALNNTTAFTASITNKLGGTIQGDNGSGLNFDGFNALQTLTVVNNGTITGNGITGDGDGIDSDGLINLTNTGVIRSINAFSATPGVPAQSEGISVGGGTITNSGTIEGLVASGNTNAVGRGISLLGNDITTGPLAGTREAIYGNATVTNQSGGLIRGDSDSGIAVDGPASGFTVTINNNAGAIIRGGGILNAAIRTGSDNDTINNAGTIDGSSGGKAINMGGGNNTLNITGGTAVVQGDINGGTGGVNLMTIHPGTGNAFSYSGTISNFNDVQIQSGTVTLNSPGLITSNASIKAGAAFVDAGTFGGTSTTLTVETGGKLYVTGSGATGLAAFTGTDQTLALQSGANVYFDLGGTTRGTGYDYVNGLTTLNLPSSGEATHFNLNYLGSWTPQVGDSFDLLDFTSLTGTPSLFDFTPAPTGYVWDTSTFATTGTISLNAAPEPGRAVLLLSGLASLMLRRRRHLQKSSCPTAQRV